MLECDRSLCILKNLPVNMYPYYMICNSARLSTYDRTSATPTIQIKYTHERIKKYIAKIKEFEFQQN